MNATIHLDMRHHVGIVDRRIFGGFVEHLGRCVYEGIYDPGNPLSDENGFRRDVLEAMRPLGMTVMRYPGGNYVSACDWKDGVGPRDQRPRRPDYAWRSIESNQFGTDEFMEWCRQAKTEPMMAVNLGTAGAVDAAQLVEYCNLRGGTLWADRRIRNGSAQPYAVKLWCLGNEMDGPWQAGHVPALVYAQRAYQASFLMKGLDPTIQTVVAGSSSNQMPTYMQWDREVLEYCWPTVDFISAHRYSSNERDDSAWFLSEGVEIDRVIAEYAALIDYVRAVKKSDKRIYLSFDEWNVWYRARSGKHVDGGWSEAPHLLEEQYNLEDALVCAQYLGAFIRRADVVKVACLAQIVNVIAPILTRREGVLLQPIYYPFALYSQHGRGLSLRAVVDSPIYYAGARGEAPALDVAATYDEQTRQAAVFVVNRSQTSGMDVEVRLADQPAARVTGVDVLSGEDVKATNTWEEPNRVGLQSGQAKVHENAVITRLPPASFAAIRFSTGAR